MTLLLLLVLCLSWPSAEVWLRVKLILRLASQVWGRLSVVCQHMNLSSLFSGGLPWSAEASSLCGVAASPLTRQLTWRLMSLRSSRVLLRMLNFRNACRIMRDKCCCCCCSSFYQWTPQALVRSSDRRLRSKACLHVFAIFVFQCNKI